MKSNLSFSHSVFKRLVQQTYKNKDVFRKGLMKGAELIKIRLHVLYQHLPCIFFPHNVFKSFLVSVVQPFTAQSRLITTLRKKPFENIVGKGENAGNQHFLIFLPYFLPIPQQISIFSHIYFVICSCCQVGTFYKFVIWYRVYSLLHGYS